jgi:peptidoglycan/xylan/chitin deacetylase (PgdA/CDA1 family)
MKKLAVMLFCLISLEAFAAGSGKVVTNFPDPGPKKVALTFDACESKTAAYFDMSILNYLIENKIPASIFLSGRFARRNEAEIKEIAAKYPFIEFENHSMNHNNHMERLSDKKVISEVADNEKLVASITGRKPAYFRFPAGNYNQHDLDLVNGLGLKVVHWTYASGDPDKNITAPALENEINTMTKPGNILIFHINGRGWSTGKALPEIVKDLKAKGYTFVRLEDVVK